MNLFRLLQHRDAADRPVRIACIGAGKFATMFFSRVHRTPGMRLAAVADLSPERAKRNLTRAGCDADNIDVAEDAMAAINGDVDVVIEATGDPVAGIRHALAAIDAGKHVVMVNVEADALAGPLLARRAADAGVVYSLAYGDQPALIAEMVDWARTAGFDVTAAGKGTKYLPAYHDSTPDSVWGHYGLSPDDAAAGGMNPQMFNSFLDGTKSAIEMAAVANATGLTPPADGLGFPPAGTDDLANVCRPAADGGALEGPGMVEVVSSLNRDGSEIARDLRWGVYVIFEGDSEYARRCFQEYGLATDDTGKYAAMYKPFHLIGLELGISVASAALRGEATGVPTRFSGDAVAVAKRDLAPGDRLDGEGGYTVWGKLIPAAKSLHIGALPIGLAGNVDVIRPVRKGTVLSRADVALDATNYGVMVRAEMEAMFRPVTEAAAQ